MLGPEGDGIPDTHTVPDCSTLPASDSLLGVRNQLVQVADSLGVRAPVQRTRDRLVDLLTGNHESRNI